MKCKNRVCPIAIMPSRFVYLDFMWATVKFYEFESVVL